MTLRHIIIIIIYKLSGRGKGKELVYAGIRKERTLRTDNRGLIVRHNIHLAHIGIFCMVLFSVYVCAFLTTNKRRETYVYKWL